MSVDVLIVGSGGREHALAWKLKQSPRIGKLYIAPGNAGTKSLGENVPIGAMQLEELSAFAREKGIGLTVVGPDDPLAAGIVDLFQSRGQRIWGPNKAAAQLESSKVYAKEFMEEAGIPTAQFRTFRDFGSALGHARVQKLPIVIKASGLALGKGVYICRTQEEVDRALEDLMVKRVHKDAGSEIVIEDYLEGEELSIHALTDGIQYLLFPPAQDHKRALEGDQGQNTGGMGTIAPLPWATSQIMQRIETRVVAPTIEGLKQRGILYQGILYPGVMETLDGPRVLEFNARFGDPETQVYMRLLKGDLLDLLEACIDEAISDAKKSVEWEHGFAANIVLASGGYPEKYETGFPISGIEAAEAIPGVIVFHAGTKYDGESLVTSGGRVLGVSAVGDTLKEALDTAYKAADLIQFEGKHMRRDIGKRSL